METLSNMNESSFAHESSIVKSLIHGRASCNSGLVGHVACSYEVPLFAWRGAQALDGSDAVLQRLLQMQLSPSDPWCKAVCRLCYRTTNRLHVICIHTSKSCSATPYTARCGISRGDTFKPAAPAIATQPGSCSWRRGMWLERSGANWRDFPLACDQVGAVTAVPNVRLC